MTQQERWQYLLTYLIPERPPAMAQLGDLYVHPPNSSADEIVRTFRASPNGCQKFLLVGARGGGKSTELRRLEELLRSTVTIASIDLDASGVSPGSVSAFDLLYLSGLALIRLVPEKARDDLYKTLIAAYGGDAKSLGMNARDALSGLMSFADAAGKLGAALDLVTGVPVISGGLTIAHAGVRLLNGNKLVPETSPAGRKLQDACRAIAQEARQAHGNRPLCVLIDGLEKMNGEANERFQQVFCYTRLLADAEWMAAIAAPPSTLTATNSAMGLGYSTLPVWGFAPEDASTLQTLLNRRLQVAQLDPVKAMDQTALARLVEQSGGLPRHAIQMLRYAVETAHSADAASIDSRHVQAGIQRVARSLALGLTQEDLDVLLSVHRRHLLPGGERAASLFADGRILARAPTGDLPLPSFAVHPVLEPALPLASLP